MNTAKPPTNRCTVYYDGACPLCSKEIAVYRNWKGGEQMNWVDASRCDPEQLGGNLTREQALARLHCRDEAGNLIDGAEAFVEIWSRLRWLSYLTPLLSSKLVLRVLERCYRGFLSVRRRIHSRKISANS